MKCAERRIMLLLSLSVNIQHTSDVYMMRAENKGTALMHPLEESWAVQLLIFFKLEDTPEDGWIIEMYRVESITYWLNVCVVSDAFLLNGIYGRLNVTMTTQNSESEICIKDGKGEKHYCFQHTNSDHCISGTYQIYNEYRKMIWMQLRNEAFCRQIFLEEF